MITNSDIFHALCEMAPLTLQMDFDNAGFLLGRKEAEVSRVLLSLDLTPAVVQEAVEQSAQLVITHHPLIFRPIRSVCNEKLLRLVENGIAVISMHTNLDIAHGGVNDVLLECLGGTGDEPLDDAGCGRIGELPQAMSMTDFAQHCKEMLQANGLRYYDAGRPVQKLAVMGGAGGDCVNLAFDRGCDTYVTADIKYDRFLEAAELGLNLIDAGHYCTEAPVMPVLCRRLQALFPQIDFLMTHTHGQLIRFL